MSCFANRGNLLAVGDTVAKLGIHQFLTLLSSEFNAH